MNPKHWRPDYSGQQRTGAYPFVLWRDQHGVVHEANLYSNLALCELWHAKPSLFVIEVDRAAPPDAVVTCLACVAWAALQAEESANHAAKRRRGLAESLRACAVDPGPRPALIPRDERGPGDQLHQPLGRQLAGP